MVNLGSSFEQLVLGYISDTTCIYGKSCISSYSKKELFFTVYELIKKFFFLRNGTVRTNKMKF